MIQTSLLRHFSLYVADMSTSDEELDVHLPGFTERVVRLLVKFLQGQLDLSFEWLEKLELVAKADMEMLAFHLDIPVLQCAAIDCLHRALIGNGQCPNSATMIHIWAVSEPCDPMRRLALASFYLNVIILGGTFALPGGGNQLQLFDYGEDMWLSDLHEMLEAYSSLDKVQNRDEWRSFNGLLDPRFVEEKGRLAFVIGQYRWFRAKGRFQDDSLFRFLDDSASLKQRVEALSNQSYTIADLSEPVDMPTLLDEDLSSPSEDVSTPTRLSDEEEDGNSEGQSLSLKRKLPEDSADSPRPTQIYSPRLGCYHLCQV